MGLQEGPDRFKKQQGQCQSTRISIASNNRATETPKAVSAAAARVPAPSVKFSDNTERLQHIHSIRNAPDGAQVKRVIDLLLKTRQAFTPEGIYENCSVDVNHNETVFKCLTDNPKVHYDGKCFSYKSKHAVKDRSQVLSLVQKFPEGIPVIDLKDAYPSAMEDLQALKAAGDIWLLSSFNAQEDIAYPNDPKLPRIKVDDALKKCFRKIELPSNMVDIEKYLEKNGMKPATDSARRSVMVQSLVGSSNCKEKKKKKKPEISKRTKLTNAHLPELFENWKN
ncbi:putative transcription factor TFIIE beta subunit, DNA-binding domain-containing protein [Rosa chinensis]|uniref:Putative transcription factor TFIIE beta subunit, DNA-binding domain-containing protein n=1 Tax=Rosa chinensis TaxID=74649 RepID=A0A2P6QHU0_ROSCH|nr:uncharacterized protein LOC112202505 [Rosa chinensis]XP_040375477.1 uncharacterized protein LOC112202505 [Rosa chinensis]XP_040375478.1 uncharacterized protein LOC112202505 [Rosa chinensis]PRQ33734.1 putative transcription factor TFIIE beta subunit, DNA-binding domain-containing protein [Rosa chinensis]